MPIFANLATMLFFIHALASVGSFIWNQRHRVNHDVIWAAVNVYLLLGLVWSYGYEFLELANPQSFTGPDPNLNRDDFFYFSYVTLATLGYGDIVPATRPARAMAIFEALTGQLYLAILIARLVGAYVAKVDSER
jgi:polyferredoxin